MKSGIVAAAVELLKRLKSILHSSRNRRNLSGVARRIVVTALEQVIGEVEIAANRTSLVAIDLALDMRIFCGGRLRGEICRIRLAQLRTPSPRLGTRKI